MQMVLLMPALFAVMFLALQAALYSYAMTVAGTAAQDGARAGSAYDNRNSPGAGRAAAVACAQPVPRRARGLDRRDDDGAIGTSVTVTGRALCVLPGLSFPVHRLATFPWERLR